MRIDWDERKNRLNQRKHGVSFELASLVFADPDRLIVLDRVDETGEQRWHAIGRISHQLLSQSAILLVVHVYREDLYGEEVIRIISARAAQKRDIGRYATQEVDEI
jgi:uncharacterized DUF497 family protein